MDKLFLHRIRQRFDATSIEDVEGEVDRQLAGCGSPVRPGAGIAIAIGSRGIDNISTIIRGVVRWVKAQGGLPFIVPAMGSHGGATAEGQRAIIEGYGITEAYCGAPIRSSMDVVELPSENVGLPVFLDREASLAEGIIVVNRIKPHTSFRGAYESGLFKMMAIGLGNQAQALAIHGLGVAGLREVMPKVAGAVLKHARILLGLAIVENAYDQTMLVRAISPDRIEQEEPDLLDLARKNMPRLPIEDIDILIVDEIGKDISGVGMDTNVIGRLKIRGQPEPQSPRIKTIFVRDLSAGTHGNALGIGLADVTTRRLFKKIDFVALYENVFTTTFLERGKIPIVAETDRQAIGIALRSCGLTGPENARIVRIRNTLHLDRLLVSSAVLKDLQDRPEIQIAPAEECLFDDTGNLPAFPVA